MGEPRPKAAITGGVSRKSSGRFQLRAVFQVVRHRCLHLLGQRVEEGKPLRDEVLVQVDAESLSRGVSVSSARSMCWLGLD